MNRKKVVLWAAPIILAIVIAAIILIPPMQHRNNESFAINALCTIAITQAQFQGSRAIDQNLNGTGEFGTLGELAATSPLRGNSETPQFEPFHPQLSFIPNSFGPKIGDTLTKKGYLFKVYLPGGITDNGTSVAFRPEDTKKIEAQENRFRTYAWPVSKDSGTRCFAVDNAGKVVACQNIDSNGELIYVGNKIPAFDAATDKAVLDNIDDMPASIKPGAIARDGQIWVLVEKAYKWIED